MIERSVKSLPKSTDKKKFRPASSSGSGYNKASSPARSSSKFSSGYLSTESTQQDLETVCQSQNPGTKLLETRNEGKESVEQFTRDVGTCIEKNNPFKDKVLYPSEMAGKSVEPCQFHRKLMQDNQIRSCERFRGQEEASKKNDEGNNRSKSRKSARKSENDKSDQREPYASSKRIAELAQAKKKVSRSCVETRRCNFAPKTPDSGERRRVTPLLSPYQPKKPSEIPLRKNRAGSTRTRKQVSQMVQEPRSYYEIYAINKSLAPLDELNLRSEFQLAFNSACSSDDQNVYDENKRLLGTKKLAEMETSSTKTVETYFSGSSIPATYSSELLEEHSSGAQQFRIIDLEQMKTTSFTILQSDRVIDKKKTTVDKATVVNPKAISSVKGKNSKKNLSRTSSKGNKLGLKARAKKSKRELNLLKKEKRNEKSIRECLETGKTWWENRKAGSSIKEEPQKEVGLLHVPVKLVRTRAKSFLRGVETPKNWYRMPSRVPSNSNVQKDSSPKAENPTENIQTSEECKKEERNTQTECLNPPSSTEEEITEDNFVEAEEGTVRSSKTVIFSENLTGKDSTVSVVDSEKRSNQTEIEDATDSTEDSVNKTSEADEPQEKGDLPNVKTQTNAKSTENILKCKARKKKGSAFSDPFDWLFKGKKNHDDAVPCEVAQTTNPEGGKSTEENPTDSHDVAVEALPSELAEEPGPLNVSVQKPQRSCSSLKRVPGEERRLCKTTEGTTKTSRKKKIRPDAGGRRLPSPSSFFNSDSTLMNKVVPDIRQRSGLTRSYVRDEKRDIFEDVVAVKLKRRNSEPFSLRGYVWKCADVATTRGHKPSVSSMASSLRHLNTDDIDDFTLWEALPQRKTAWETSLYHFKRPWSVLSCSVFKDNRRSSTPGVILENLRNGGTLRRFTTTENERMRCRKENPFDVEPSIAQKNIDIRNWLAALNFPMIPSTSSDFLSESNCGTQSTSEAQNRNKIQTTPRRRKVMPSLKFSEEPAEKRCEEMEKLKKSPKRAGSDPESLTELTRGYSAKEQYVSFEHSIRRPNANANLCVHSKSAGESFSMEMNDGIADPRNFKSMEGATQPQASISATIADGSSARGDQVVEKCIFKNNPSKAELAKGEPGHLMSRLNIWKYLFLLTILILVINYFLSR